MEKARPAVEDRGEDLRFGRVGKIASGKGNLVRQVEQFRELGAHVKKPLPRSIVDAADSDNA